MADKPRFSGEWVRVSDAFDLRMGRTPSRKNLSYWRDGNHDWVSIADLGSFGKYVGGTKERINNLAIAETGIKPAPANTVLMSFKLSLGKTAITTAPVYTNEAIMAFVDKGVYPVDSSFMYHQCRAKDWTANTNTAVMGKTLNKKTLGQQMILLPGLTEQKAIARQLDFVECQLDNANEQLDQLDTLVKSRFVEMFGDLKNEPNKWDIKLLGEVCATRLGKMLDAKRQTGNCSYPYLANTNVQWFRFDLTGLRYMDFTDDDRIKFGLKNGDVLVTEGGEIGRCAIWREEIPNCFFQKAVHRVRCDSEVLLPEYFVWCFKMKADLGLFEPYVSRSTIAHLTGKKIKQVPIPLPPFTLQQEFADFVAAVDKSRFVVQQQIDKLQILYDSLAQEYFA